MRQSNVIFGVILFAFVMYVTMRGQLPAYLDLFKKKTDAASTTSTTSSGKSFLSSILGAATNAAQAAQSKSLAALSSGSAGVDDSSVSI